MHIKTSSIPALMITAGLAMGLSAPAAAQYGDRQPERQTDHQSDRKQLRVSDMRFVQHETLEGADVVNANNEAVGTIDDLLIDRGSGEISDVIIQFDDFLGFGGTKVAVPFESLRFDRDEGEVGMDVTKEQLERMGEFTPPQWDEVDSSDSDEQWYS
ncbi:MAG: PRC-barrel domain-containing protein, partial [Planctomycetota bacterium]